MEQFFRTHDYLVEHLQAAVRRDLIAFGLNADGELQLTGKGAYLPDANSRYQYTVAGANLADDAWHHIALSVMRQGAAAVYVDGVRRFTTNETNIGSIVTNSLIAGARRITVSAENAVYEYDRLFTGKIDEIRVWAATMNSNLIVSNRKLRFTGAESGLVAYYPFEIKKVDSFNQVITTGNSQDLCNNGSAAVMVAVADGTESALSYVDDAPALRVKPTETNVSFSYTASDDKVIISIDEDPEMVEGCTLNFTVRDLLDENGNYSEPAVWSAFINRNELAWQNDEIAVNHDLYRINVVKEVKESSYSYETNKEIAPVQSATDRINSKAWRGAGADDCRKIVILTDSLTGEFSAMLPPIMYKVTTPVVVATSEVLGDASVQAMADMTQPTVTYKDSVMAQDGKFEYYEYNTPYKYVYHSDPIFTVAQSDHTDGAFGISSYEVESSTTII